MEESFSEKVERLREERETKPSACSHCGWEIEELENYSRPYGGNVGAHWLCVFCCYTQSASVLGSGGQPNFVVRDVAAMLNLLRSEIIRIQQEKE